MWKFRLARSRKLPCQNIVKKCDDNNYTNSIVMKIMITNTSARPMCKVNYFRFIWYPSPHTKKLATPLMSPWQKKIVSPLRSLPPNPKLLPARLSPAPLPLQKKSLKRKTNNYSIFCFFFFFFILQAPYHMRKSRRGRAAKQSHRLPTWPTRGSLGEFVYREPS